MQWNDDHLLRGVKLADDVPEAMKTLVPVAVSSAGKVRTVAKKERNTMSPPASFRSVFLFSATVAEDLHTEHRIKATAETAAFVYVSMQRLPSGQYCGLLLYKITC